MQKQTDPLRKIKGLLETDLILPPKEAYELSIGQYAERTGLTKSEVRSRCEQGMLPSYRTDGGHWRIKTPPVNGSVSREEYESVIRENARLNAVLDSMKSLLSAI